MSEIRTYVISIIAASLISAAAIGITNKMELVGMITKLLTGLFLAVTILSPICRYSSFNILQYYRNVALDTDEIISQGQEFLDSERAQFIKERTEAYILSKADSMGVALDVDIILSDVSPNIPIGITIDGEVSPYVKQKLQKIITEDLGIQEASQVWL